MIDTVSGAYQCTPWFVKLCGALCSVMHTKIENKIENIHKSTMMSSLPAIVEKTKSNEQCNIEKTMIACWGVQSWYGILLGTHQL